MIPDDTKIYLIVFTVQQCHYPINIMTILRVFETTWGKVGMFAVDYQMREQSMVFFRPDNPPWME